MRGERDTPRKMCDVDSARSMIAARGDVAISAAMSTFIRGGCDTDAATRVMRARVADMRIRRTRLQRAARRGTTAVRQGYACRYVDNGASIALMAQARWRYDMLYADADARERVAVTRTAMSPRGDICLLRAMLQCHDMMRVMLLRAKIVA